jgi:cephalosporin hydroxylase
MDDPDRLLWSTDLPPSLLSTVQEGVFKTEYRGRTFLKSPFDIVLYLQLLQRLRPRTVVEISSYQGGSTLWFADTLTALGIDTRILAIDREPTALDDPRITCLAGDAATLDEAISPELVSSFERPLLVVEDSAHLYEPVLAVLTFFHPILTSGDYIVIEDGVVDQFHEPFYRRYENGPNRAVSFFLGQHPGAYAVDRDLCDFYGLNVTYNPNGWLRRR